MEALSAWGLSAETVAPDAWERIEGMEREYDGTHPHPELQG